MRTPRPRATHHLVLAALVVLAPACDDDDGSDGVPTTVETDDPETTIDTDGTSVGGTSSAATAGGTGTVVVTEPSLPVTASVGQSIAVPLDAHPTTGYSWIVVNPGDPAVVAFVDRSYEPSEPETDGSGGIETIVFRALGAGETVVALAYAFEGDVPTTDPAELVELVITVR